MICLINVEKLLKLKYVPNKKLDSVDAEALLIESIHQELQEEFELQAAHDHYLRYVRW